MKSLALLWLGLGFSLTGFASASMNSPEPSLPFGDINVLILTDVHSWVGGHGRREGDTLNVDYGNVLSFYERLKEYCDQTDKDFWFVMNGDWIDGTGLALDGDPSSLIPLLQKMPWDVVNTGNHELYRTEVINYMRRPGGFVDWWGGRHLASNIVMNDGQGSATQEDFSNKYRILEGQNSNVLVFGFLYNLPDPSSAVTVKLVEDVVKEDWFRLALRSELYDAILVMAHMGTDDPSIAVLRDAIREHLPEDSTMPIQFVAGHTHLRRYEIVDDYSTSFEAGRYLDTVGFVSFPTMETMERAAIDSTAAGGNDSTNSTNSADTTTTTTSSLFQHVFLDANRETLQHVLGYDDFDTPNGQELSKFIQTTQQKAGLTQKIGCAPKNYHINRTIYEDDSLWKLYMEEVVPTQLDVNNDDASSTIHRAILVDQGSWRYDLLGGPELVYDDVIAVSPFDEPIYSLGFIPGSIVLTLNETMNANNTMTFYNTLPEYILAGTVEADQVVNLHCHSFELPGIQAALEKIYPDFDPDVITPTNMTSTSIWLAFVLEQWRCPGDTGIHVPWFNNGGGSSGGSGGSSSGSGNDGTKNSTSSFSTSERLMTPILVAIFSFIFICGSFYILCITIKQFCCGQAVVHANDDEFETMKGDNNNDNNGGRRSVAAASTPTMSDEDGSDEYNSHDYDDDEFAVSEFA